MFTHPQHVTCHVWHITCRMSNFTCSVYHVTIFFFWQSIEAYWWRVCYQQGLPILVIYRMVIVKTCISPLPIVEGLCFLFASPLALLGPEQEEVVLLPLPLLLLLLPTLVLPPGPAPPRIPVFWRWHLQNSSSTSPWGLWLSWTILCSVWLFGCHEQL